MLKLALFILPLGLDTFVVSAALGLGGLPKQHRFKVSILMSTFEMAMPVAGLLIGHALGSAIGSAADYVAAGALVALAVWMLLGDDDEEKVAGLASNNGLALIGLGVSISLDELALGFTIGLLHLSIVLAVTLIGVQAFLFAQLGLRLGARLGEAVREGAERLAALALLGLAVLLVVEKLAA